MLFSFLDHFQTSATPFTLSFPTRASEFALGIVMGGVGIAFVPQMAMAQDSIAPSPINGITYPRNLNCTLGDCSINGGPVSPDGSNQFSSFSHFNTLDTSLSFFNGLITVAGPIDLTLRHPNSVERIFVRVDGGNVTQIGGLLSTQSFDRMTSADLFWLSPGGIVFGPDSHIDISNFVATSGSTVRGAGGERFGIGHDDLFNGAPEAMLFDGAATNPIQMITNASSLAFNPNPGQNIVLFGGELLLGGRQINIPENNLVLGGVEQSPTAELQLNGDGTVALAGALPEEVQNITLNGTQILGGSAAPNGNVSVYAQNLAMSGSSISTLADGSGGNITLKITKDIAAAPATSGRIDLSNSALQTRSTPSNAAGDIIHIGELDQLNLDGSRILTDTDGAGGNILFSELQGNLTLEDSDISTAVGESALNAGKVEIRGAEVTMEGGSINTRAKPGGATAGDIALDFISLDLDRSILETTTVSSGGNISVTAAQSIDIRENSRLRTTSEAGGGNIDLSASDSLTISAALITTNSQTGGGDLAIATPGSISMANQSLIQTQGNESLLTLTANRLQASLDDGNDIIAADPSSTGLQLNLSDSPEPEFSFAVLPEFSNVINEISTPSSIVPALPATPPSVTPPSVTPPPAISPPTTVPPVFSTPTTPTSAPPTATPSNPARTSPTLPPLLRLSLLIPSSRAEELEALAVRQLKGNNSSNRDGMRPQCGSSTGARNTFTHQGRGGVRPTLGVLGNKEILIDLGALSLAEESRGQNLSLFPIASPQLSATRMNLHRAVVMPREAETWSKTRSGEIHLAGKRAVQAIAPSSCNV